MRILYIPLLNVASVTFSGSTERVILANIGDIVEHALPIEKMKTVYSELNSTRNLIVNCNTFCHNRVAVLSVLQSVFNNNCFFFNLKSTVMCKSYCPYKSSVDPVVPALYCKTFLIFNCKLFFLTSVAFNNGLLYFAKRNGTK